MAVIQDPGAKQNASYEDDSSSGLQHLEEQSLPPETNRKIEVNSFSDLNRSAALEISMRNKSAGRIGTMDPQQAASLRSYMRSVNEVERREKLDHLSKTHQELKKQLSVHNKRRTGSFTTQRIRFGSNKLINEEQYVSAR